MPDVVCQLSNQSSQLEVIWSSRGGFFRPYLITGPQLTELRQAADKTRRALAVLVGDINFAGDRTVSGLSAYELAAAGSNLFNDLLPAEDEIAGKVARWLEDLRANEGLISLEVVVEEQSSDPKTVLSIPWNLVYDDLADTYQADFESGDGVERWRPFWGVRYNLTCGRRVEPWRRLPTWSDPRVVVVIDPTVYDALDEDQRRRLDAFLAGAKVQRLGSLNELKKALSAGYPRLLYWMGHACPDYLQLGAERIFPGDLRNLLRSYSRRERPEGMLAFLNACQTAESGESGSFLEVLHTFGFTGAIATEQQTIDNFANEFGLAFLEGFLHQGKPLGELLHGLRLEKAPLGLLYGAHCPPEIRVKVGPDGEAAAALPEIRESTSAPGARLGVATARPTLGAAATRSPGLPAHPYPSLTYYDQADRLLFTGRDTDVVRFSATLDLPDTRILVLHGESGLGKSSFLRAGVIPYLEEQCVGYRLLRGPDGRAVIVQVANDPVGGLARALLDITAHPAEYTTPTGESLTIDLRSVLDESLGVPADLAGLRSALLADAGLLAELLKRLADELPHALVLILDQAEELFTLARSDEEVAWRDQALRLLQRVADVPSDVKVIVTLRTEYYGRLLDHLREGRQDMVGVRDDLLRDFSKPALVEAIERPTLEAPLVNGEPSPRRKYGFHYAEGVAGMIADGVLALRSENQDSVLPLMQVICTRLYMNKEIDPDADRVVTTADLAAIGGVEGGLRSFAEDAMDRSMGLNPEDRESFRTLYTQLYTRQADGTLTTWLAPRETLERSWRGEKPFGEVLEAARGVRLLRVDELRIEGERPRSYVRLGHDALAKVAAAWQARREIQERLKKERRRRMVLIGWLAGISLLATVFAYEVFRASRAEGLAREAERLANEQATLALVAEERAKKQEAKEKSQRRIAEEATAQARSRELAAHSATERNKRMDRSLLLAVAALGSANTLEARDSLCKALEDRPGLTSFLHLERGDVRSVAFSPDGKTIAAAYPDGRGGGGVVLWDAATRTHLADLPFPVKEGPVLSVAFSPDGKTIAAGYDVDGSVNGVRLWDAATRTHLADLPFPVDEGPVQSVAFSHDGKAIAAGYYVAKANSGGVVLWDAAARTLLAESPLLVKEGAVLSVAFSPDGKTIAAGYSVAGAKSGGVVLWDAATRTPLFESPLLVKEGYVQGVAFSPDGKTIAAGCGVMAKSGGVVLWDAATRTRLPDKPIAVDEGPVLSVAFSRDGKAIAAGYGVMERGGGVVLWDAATRTRLPDKPIAVDEGPVLSVAFSRDSKTIAAGFGSLIKGGVVLWDTAAHTRLAHPPLLVNQGIVVSVAFSPDGKAIAAGYDVAKAKSGGVVLWDAAARTPLAGPPLLVKEGSVTSVAFSRGGKTIAVGSEVGRDGRVVLWDAATRTPLFESPLLVKEGNVQSVAFSPDGKTIAAGYFVAMAKSGGVVLWDAATRTPLFESPLLVKDGSVWSVAFSPDGKAIAAGYRGVMAKSGGVVLWDAAARTPLAGPPRLVKDGSVWSVAFSPDGKAIAAGCVSTNDGSGVMLWDAAALTPLADRLLHVDEGPVGSVAFSPDGKTIAAGYYHGGVGGVVLWDAASRTRALDDPLRVSEGQVSSVAFSPDGKAIAAGYAHGDVGGVVLWDADPESWRRRAGRIANRNFTREEWRDYFPETAYHATFPDLPVPAEVTPR